MILLFLDIIFGVCAATLLYFQYTRRTRSGPALPPGPPQHWLLGNALQMPTEHAWDTFTEWKRTYGDVSHARVFNKHFIILGSLKAASDLLDKRSSIYSDRAEFVMFNELCGFGWNFGFQHYGKQWRTRRKLFISKFNPDVVNMFNPVLTRVAHYVLRELLHDSSKLREALLHAAGKTVIESMYGLRVKNKDDPYVAIGDEAVYAAIQVVQPAKYLVDSLPILKHWPEWLPGGGFQREARLFRKVADAMYDIPFDAAQAAMASGRYEPSFTTNLLSEGKQDIDAIRSAGATAYHAGSDTTVSALTTFVLAMLLYPDVQRKAQAELDSVVGIERLPTFEDRQDLPYINALVQEIHRWHPVTPIGIPHASTEEDMYGGMYIPKGSIVIANTHAILHDIAVCGHSPEDFRPERFLEDLTRTSTMAFGFGRRICPGRFMADNSIFLTAANMLTCFEISPVKKGVLPERRFTGGFVSRPEHFDCLFIPRSDAKRRLILNTILSEEDGFMQ